MSGLKSRNKGKLAERRVVNLAKAAGLPARRTWETAQAGSEKPCCDVVVAGLECQVKCRAHGYGNLYDHLREVDFAVVKRDHKEELAVLTYRALLYLLQAVGSYQDISHLRLDCGGRRGL